MKKIKLTQKKYALVDNEDFDKINNFKWHYNSNGYARTSNPKLYMHHLIKPIFNNFEIDHINRNRLDNRKSNLRIVNHSDNLINTSLRKDNKSGYKGVSWDKFRNKWTTRIQVNKKNISLGRYSNIQGAWLARKMAERIYYGLVFNP